MKLTFAAAVVLIGVLLLAANVAPAPSAASNAASIRILFDFGDGAYVWARETVADPAGRNATWNAVQHAASLEGIAIRSRWFAGGLGVAILDVGDRHPPGYVGLYEWNGTAHRWDFTSTGISGLVVRDGDSIALDNAGYDSVTFAGRTPVPTPDDAIPSVEFRGDASNRGVSASPVPDRVGVLWDRDLGTREIGSTPAVAYGRVFVTTMKGLDALDERSGARIWTNPRTKGFSSPAVFDGSVIVGTSNGTVVRVNATDGSVQWETKLLASTGFSGITSSPKVAFDWVFVGTFNESGGPGEVVSLWASNGSVAWRHATGSVHFSSPAYADGTVYVGVMGLYNTTSQVTFDPPYGVLALDASTGGQRWFFPTNGSVAASPAIAGPNLITPSKDGTVYALNRTTGGLAWEATIDAGISSPAVWKDTVFVGGGAFGGSGRVVALNASTGAIRWSFTPNGPVQSAVTWADGKVLFATNAAHGTIYALNATDGSSVWSFEPAPAEYILGSPVAADGIVLAPSDNGHVVALTLAHSALPMLPVNLD
ncbi:MAG: PQQ-binding-like beta-propeller repeat protein, partial [Thermoplasmata archaeon]|nr:PQQ-binding-like beta-propeller repeat protein [Thermoplasmata archaeon]